MTVLDFVSETNRHSGNKLTHQRYELAQNLISFKNLFLLIQGYFMHEIQNGLRCDCFYVCNW